MSCFLCENNSNIICPCSENNVNDEKKKKKTMKQIFIMKTKKK